MTPWYGTTAVLLAAQLNKKCSGSFSPQESRGRYALPVKVIECLVAHFCAFATEEQVLPLVWHRALLIFIQRLEFKSVPLGSLALFRGDTSLSCQPTRRGA